MADELNNPTKRELALEQLVMGILLHGEMRRPGYVRDVAKTVGHAASLCRLTSQSSKRPTARSSTRKVTEWPRWRRSNVAPDPKRIVLRRARLMPYFAAQVSQREMNVERDIHLMCVIFSALSNARAESAELFEMMWPNAKIAHD